VTGVNVLMAIFAERESHAVFFLQEQEMTRQDAVNFMPTGLTESRATVVEESPPTLAGVRKGFLWGFLIGFAICAVRWV
jgi:hypothetical protein